MTEPESRGWPYGPTAYERRHGNARMRVLTGAIGIPIVIAAVWLGGWAFFLFICAAIAGAMLEFYWICEAKGARPHKAIGVIFGLLLAVAFFPPSTGALFAPSDGADHIAVLSGAVRLMHARLIEIVGVIALAVIASLVAEMRRAEHAPIFNVSTTLGGIVYVGLFLASVIGIREFFVSNPQLATMQGFARSTDGMENAGAFMVIATLVTIWICDSAAYYVGRAMGRHKMAPRISPKKTWEGGAGGLVFAVASMVGFKYGLLDSTLTLGDAIFLGLVVGVLGQIGDLAESQFKRDAGVKDSSQIIPGHGGVFDRLDSLMFVAPVVYLYLNILAFVRSAP